MVRLLLVVKRHIYFQLRSDNSAFFEEVQMLALFVFKVKMAIVSFTIDLEVIVKELFIIIVRSMVLIKVY